MRAVSAREAGANVVEQVRQRRLNPREVWGHPYGMPKLDGITGGIQYEPQPEMSVIIARPKVGKSLIVAQWVNDVATYLQLEREDLDVRVILTEMTVEAYIRRMAAAAAVVSPKALRQGTVSDAQFDRFTEHVARIQGLPIHYLQGHPTLAQVESFLRHEDKEYGRRVGWWVVDHVGHLVGETGNRTESLTQLSKGLMTLSHSLAPSMLITHQKRKQQGDGKEITLDDIAGADAWGKDADNVFSLARVDEDVEYQMGDIEDAVPLALNIIASREGGTGSIPLILDTKHARIIDPSSRKRKK